MKIWLVYQNERKRYDAYDSAVVCAETEDDAQRIHPSGEDVWRGTAWASDPIKVMVKLLGEAAPGLAQGVILASFNAG
jgi:hypothetical protein